MINDNISEQDFLEICMQIILDNQNYVDILFQDTGHLMENTGYFGVGLPDVGQGMRSTNNYAALNAYL